MANNKNFFKAQVEKLALFKSMREKFESNLLKLKARGEKADKGK